MKRSLVAVNRVIETLEGQRAVQEVKQMQKDLPEIVVAVVGQPRFLETARASN